MSDTIINYITSRFNTDSAVVIYLHLTRQYRFLDVVKSIIGPIDR